MKCCVFPLMAIALLPGCRASEFDAGADPRAAQFLNECRRERMDCVDVTFEAVDRTGYKVRNLYYAGRTSSVAQMLGGNGESDIHRYPCAAYSGRRIRASRDLSRWKEIPIEVVKDASGEFCAERYDLSVAGAGEVVAIEYAYREQRKNGYIDYFYPPPDSEVNVRVGGSFLDKVYVQSAMTSAGFLSGEIRQASFRYKSGRYPPDSFFVLTTYGSVGEFAHEYDAKSTGLLALADARRIESRGAGLDGLLATYNALRLEYRADASNAGILPRRDVGTILSSGFVHCMDAVQVGRYLALRQGLKAVPVLVGTRKPAPDITVTADTQWLDHVILYFDGMGKFIDLTAKPGRQVVDDTSFVYKHIGIRTDTGDFVLVQ